MNRIVVYDPTATDTQSKVRGVGRYLQTLLEAFQGEWVFTSDLKQVTSNDIFINPFFNITQPPLKLSQKPKKHIVIIHDLIPLKYPQAFPLGLKGKWYTFLGKRRLHSIDLIVTDSQASKKDIITILKIPEKKIEIIYATVPQLYLPHMDTDGSRHPFHTEEGHSVPEFSKLPLEQATNNPLLKGLQDFIIYVGDATWNKNLVNMAVAVQMANVTCVCVGKVFDKNILIQKPGQTVHPWQRMLYSFMNYVKDDKRFIFPGFISDVELLALYKQARLNVLVSHDEGFGLSYIEAGYLGTPSVLADRPIFHEIAGQAGVFARSEDPKDIAQKISELFYDNVKRQKITIETFTRAQDFSPARFKKRWSEVLARVA